ncbi:MAG: hypothetical protein WCY41_05005 [Candidatus Micrarchaeia archaeon]
MAAKAFIMASGGKGGIAPDEGKRLSVLSERFSELHEQYRIAILCLKKIRAERLFAVQELQGANSLIASKDREISSLKQQVSELEKSLSKLERLRMAFDSGTDFFGENGFGPFGDIFGCGPKKPGQ